MDEFPSYERLVETAELIVRHADYPGKGRVVEQCRQEVADLAAVGRITKAQGEALLGILQGEGPGAIPGRRGTGPAEVRETDHCRWGWSAIA